MYAEWPESGWFTGTVIGIDQQSLCFDIQFDDGDIGRDVSFLHVSLERVGSNDVEYATAIREGEAFQASVPDAPDPNYKPNERGDTILTLKDMRDMESKVGLKPSKQTRRLAKKRKFDYSLLDPVQQAKRVLNYSYLIGGVSK